MLANFVINIIRKQPYLSNFNTLNTKKWLFNLLQAVRIILILCTFSILIILCRVNYLHQNHLRLFWKRLLIFKISIGLSTFISIDIHTNPLYPATQFAVLSTIPEGLCRLLLILIRFILF